MRMLCIQQKENSCINEDEQQLNQDELVSNVEAGRARAKHTSLTVAFFIKKRVEVIDAIFALCSKFISKESHNRRSLSRPTSGVHEFKF